jgi:phosphatidylserine/phosphatidylglycerophosphate/cardiolipin synthase-like enzyme
MATTVRVYANGDDVLLFWSVPAVIPGCRGFAIARRVTDPYGVTSESVVPNRTGFAADTPPTGGAAIHVQPSTRWPFQRFSWTDHDVSTGDTVSYRIIPVVRDSSGALVQLGEQASAWSRERTLGAPTGSRFEAFFNRGVVTSQFMSRYLAEKRLTPYQFMDRIQDSDECAIRSFLSGNLLPALLGELRAAAHGQLYAALFELRDDDLVDALCALGARAHIVLANGSNTQDANETVVQARSRDENGDARAKLIAAGVDVAANDRFVSPGALGHNKFMVRTDHTGAPITAWTGSTDWTPTGLCTQLNNGLLIKDPALAQVYLAQWHRLRNAASDFPPELVGANSTPHTPALPSPDAASATVWYSRTAAKGDLAALADVVAAAKQGVLFLLFMPGRSGVLPRVMARIGEPGLYVRGVVSELPGGRGDESTVDIHLVDGAHQRDVTLDVIQPKGLSHPFANFAAEVTRQQFLAHTGHAIIHSKILVIDPFSPNATVVTGSHNFSLSASASNDDNFVIIRGDRALAEAYAVNIIAAYDHYRWRAFISQDRHPFSRLDDDDSWMAHKLAGSRRDLQFFVGQG